MVNIKKGCPGQNTGFLKDFKTSVVPCPKCGYEIEFFADERKVRCPGCHTNVFKVSPQAVEYRDGRLIFGEEDKNCLDWCGGCLDKKDYKDIKEDKKRIGKKIEDLKELVNSVDKKDKDVVDFFIGAFKKSINNPGLIDEKIFQKLQKENPALFLRARNYYLNFIGS